MPTIAWPHQHINFYMWFIFIYFFKWKKKTEGGKHLLF